MANMIQNNFVGGEISPALYGRSDLQAYYKGCENAENFVVSKEGTLRKRHGISSFMELPKPFARCKVVPYKYDRSEGGFLLIYILDDSWTDGDTNTPTTIRVKFYDKVGNLHTWQEVLDGSNTTISYRDIAGFKGFIKDFQCKQIGDEVWITNGELYRILRVVNNEKFNVVEWEQTGVPSRLTYDKTKDKTSTHWTVTRSSYESGEGISFKNLNYGIEAEVSFETDGFKIHEEIKQHDYHGYPLILGGFYKKEVTESLKGNFLNISWPVQDKVVLDDSYVGYTGGIRLIEDIYTVAVQRFN